MNKKIVNWLDNKLYKNCMAGWDNDLFRETILKYISKSDIMLDIGAGAGIVKQENFRGLAKKVYGIDPDERVMNNKFLDKAYICLGDDMGVFKNNMFNIIISNNVLEHVSEPDLFFNEVNRVLKPGGVFITKTPNKYHYVSLIAKLTPTKFHEFYNRIRGRSDDDTFPTLYKINSIKSQKYFAKRHGLNIEEMIPYEGRPEYLRINFIFYFFGILYEKIVNLFSINNLKVIIITVFRKNK